MDKYNSVSSLPKEERSATDVECNRLDIAMKELHDMVLQLKEKLNSVMVMDYPVPCNSGECAEDSPPHSPISKYLHDKTAHIYQIQDSINNSLKRLTIGEDTLR